MPEHGELQFCFGVTNLPLLTELRVGPIRIRPLPEGQEALNDSTSMSEDSVVTAEGIVDIPEAIGRDRIWEYVEVQPLKSLELLLSFAHRRAVIVRGMLLRRKVGNSWEIVGRRSHYPLYGNPHGVEWFVSQDDLQSFVDTALPIVEDPILGKANGLKQALNFHCSTYRPEFEELRFLKHFMGLEILFSNFSVQQNRQQIVRSGVFKRRVTPQLRQALQALIDKEHLSQAQVTAIVGKFPELNRPSSKLLAKEFFDHIFQPYPRQVVTADDLAVFVDIRNQIANSGVMKHPDADRGDYHDVLMDQTKRLSSLMERTFLAMLHQHPSLMNVPWQWIYAAG